MLATALLLMLGSAQAQPAFLSTEGRRVQLTAAPGVELKVAAGPNYRGWSVPQLRAEYERLEDLRPGVALPTTLLLVGLTGLAVSFFAYGIALGQFFGASTAATVTFGIGTTASAAMIAIGGIQLWRGASERRTCGAQMERVERLAAEHDRYELQMDLWEQRYGPATPPPPFIGVPPVGPMPPPTAPPIVPGARLQPGELILPVVFARF